MTLTRQLLVMVAASVLLGLGARVVQDKPVPFWGFPQPVKLLQPTQAYAGAAVTADDAFPPAAQPYAIDLATAMGLYAKRKKENIHFIDARDPKLYGAGHIPGSVNIPFEKIGEYETALSGIPKDNLVVIYCDGGDCHLSHDLSELMLSQGWTRLVVYEGGWAEWSTETDFTETTETTETTE